MPVLKLISGPASGREVPVSGARVIIGRHPQCEVVLENDSISRQHAQILHIGGEYFLEDLTSRNGTYLNGSTFEGRAVLTSGDQVRLSDQRLQFVSLGDSANRSAEDSFETAVDRSESDQSVEIVLERPSVADAEASDDRHPEFLADLSDDDESFAAPFAVINGQEIDPSVSSHLPLGPGGDLPLDNEQLDASSIVHKIPAGSTDYGRDSSRSATKLKAVLEIARALTGVLNIDEVLPRTLQTLFRTFSQAEQGYILLQDSATGRLKVKASQARVVGQKDSTAPDHVAVSMTVVRRAMTTGEALISSNALDDKRFKASTSVSQLRIRSIMCVPLMVIDSSDESRAIGVIQIDTRQAGEEFDEEDLELLAAVAAQVAQAVENAEMHEALLARREIERDLEFATQVQRGFLPNERPRVELYSFSDYYEAAKSVGGDYYDYIRTPDGRIAVVLGDVAGKGVSAALLMARLYSSARYQFLTNPDPAEAVTKLNADIIDSGMGGRFITFVAMLLDFTEHTLTIANAGHMPPLFRAPDGLVTPISGDISSVPLGILPDQVYRSMSIDFPVGSSILAFTDGITEAMNAEREMYGKTRLTACFESQNGDIGDSIRAVIADVEGFSVDTIDRDDTCLVGFKHRG